RMWPFTSGRTLSVVSTIGLPGARENRRVSILAAISGRYIGPRLKESMFSLLSRLARPKNLSIMTQAPPTLADLRREIDRIDEAMHRLLMERGEIIDTLIATKKTAESGSAFRPAREADMMK